jgi:hypothetical protein
MDLEDVGRFVTGVIYTMVGSVVFVVLATLTVKCVTSFYVPIILWAWRLW